MSKSWPYLFSGQGHINNVGQIVLGLVVFGTSLACYLHSYHAKNILDWFIVPFFSAKVRFLA